MPFDPSKFRPEGSSDGREAKPYSATIIDAYFETSRFDQDQLVLVNKLDESDAMEYAWMTSGEDKRWFGLGKIQVTRGQPFSRWEIVGGGTSAKGDADDRMFRSDSDAGRLVNQLFSLPNVADLPEDFDPRVAGSWKGLHVRWAEVPVTKRQRNDETDKWVQVNTTMELPVELSVGGVKAPSAVVEVDLTTLGLTADQHEKLVAINGGDVPDAEFQKKALEIVGIGNQDFAKAVTTNVKGVRQSLPF